MTKAGNLKKQLMEISDAVNAFRSDAVQVIVIDRVLDYLIDHAHRSLSEETLTEAQTSESELTSINIPKKADKDSKARGATKLLHCLVASGFFDIARSIGQVTDYFNDNYTGPFYTYQISGLLLALCKSGKLAREVSPETNRYVYLTS